MHKIVDRMRARAAEHAPTRRGFIANAAVFAVAGIVGGAGGMLRDEALMWGAEKAADMAGVGSGDPIPTAAYASTPRTVEQFMSQAADYQLGGLEAWRDRRGMDDLPEICRDRAARTFEGPHGLRHVKEIGKGLRLWGSEIEGMPLVQAFDAEYGRWCASRLNKCRLKQEAYAEACVAVIRRADGPPRYVRYLTLLLPWENGDVVSVSRPLEVRDA
ncbi:hypothetical protein [Nisaea nitritireducens]|uniref:hypothetical protein n=1 Tax=Nisaea nitritireducens TaxID=568392 RepID=UPI0018690CAF|nr:hypothetical protein [Nisaea nitritireducens]